MVSVWQNHQHSGQVLRRRQDEHSSEVSSRRSRDLPCPLHPAARRADPRHGHDKMHSVRSVQHLLRACVDVVSLKSVRQRHPSQFYHLSSYRLLAARLSSSISVAVSAWRHRLLNMQYFRSVGSMSVSVCLCHRVYEFSKTVKKF